MKSAQNNNIKNKNQINDRNQLPKRQGLTITLNQLHNLIDELSKEFDDGTNCYSTDNNRKFQINIINKSGKSDTWKIEEPCINEERSCDG